MDTVTWFEQWKETMCICNCQLQNAWANIFFPLNYSKTSVLWWHITWNANQYISAKYLRQKASFQKLHSISGQLFPSYLWTQTPVWQHFCASYFPLNVNFVAIAMDKATIKNTICHEGKYLLPRGCKSSTKDFKMIYNMKDTIFNIAIAYISIKETVLGLPGSITEFNDGQYVWRNQNTRDHVNLQNIFLHILWAKFAMAILKNRS